MSDAPDEIGLVGNGFEWRLWNRHEDSDEQYAVRYILRDKHEAELSALKKQVEELTAERDDARRYAVEARLRENQAEDRRVSESFARTKAEAEAAALRKKREEIHRRAQRAEGQLQNAFSVAREQIEVLESLATKTGHWPAGSHWAKRAMERWLASTRETSE